MSLSYVNEDVLSQLITKIQSDTLKEKIYNNIKVSADNSSFYFLKIGTSEEAWNLSFKIKIKILSDANATQIIDCDLKGLGNEISSWASSNVIYDIGRKGSSALVLCYDTNTLYLGVNASLRPTETYEIVVDIKKVSDCSITFIKEIKQLAITPISSIDITKSGYQNQEIGNIVSNLAKVATTGDYNDLINKPSLLNVIEDEGDENITFIYN